MDKKILPHCEYIQYWYDSYDRLVSMQDANLRDKGKYRFYLYDQRGNPIQTRQWPADGLRKYTACSFSHTDKLLTESATVYLGNAHATVSKNDPLLCRFTQTDPMAEKYYDVNKFYLLK